MMPEGMMKRVPQQALLAAIYETLYEIGAVPRKGENFAPKQKL
jgi:hypothetical protein